MIFFDLTKTASSAHNSGLTRVGRRLLAELQADASTRANVLPVMWKNRGWFAPAGWRDATTGRAVAPSPPDWLFTAELFSEAERAGIGAFIESRACRMAAIFHDAIPLKFPEITWAKSVRRAPDYMRLLAGFDRVLAVSQQSADELAAFWNSQRITPRATIGRITNGADFTANPRVVATTVVARTAKSASSTATAGNAEIPLGRRREAPPNRKSRIENRKSSELARQPASLLCVGILEPRKNQSFLLDVCAALWDESLAFDLHLVGRVNPEFGVPVKNKINRLRKKYPGLHFHEAATDAHLQALYSQPQLRAAVFPTIAEGSGLPPLEAMWQGVPCVCSDLPVLREYTDAGGCLLAPPNDFPAWQTALRNILTDDTLLTRLRHEATTRPLPTWSAAATTLLRELA